jgi:uncharacterized protein with HEPN domain
MTKDPSVFIEDILDSIDAISTSTYVENIQKSEFMISAMIQDAVIRRLEIIGEAANRLPDRFTTEHSDIPWAQIIGMRNFLIHDYGRVNLELVWDTIQIDLPGLKDRLSKI